MRVLITGSRDWPFPEMIEKAFTKFGEAHPDEDMTLVSGHCPTGADAMAEEAAEKLGWEIERYPADWEQYGKRAGFIRNDEMVKTNPDVCFAFIKDHSKGATMTKNLANKAGIKVYSVDCTTKEPPF